MPLLAGVALEVCPGLRFSGLDFGLGVVCGGGSMSGRGGLGLSLSHVCGGAPLLASVVACDGFSSFLVYGTCGGGCGHRYRRAERFPAALISTKRIVSSTPIS